MIKTIDTRNITDIMLKAQNVIDGTTTYSDPLSFKDAVDIFIAMTEAAPAVEPAQSVQSGSCSNLMWATAKMREREHNRIGKMVSALEQIKQEKLSALEPAQAVPVGYRLQSIAEFDAINEWIASNDDLTIAYMRGNHDQKAIDHDKKQKALDFVRWIASLKTGGLIQARANDILSMLEAGNGE